jgi:hypothetical protein
MSGGFEDVEVGHRVRLVKAAWTVIEAPFLQAGDRERPAPVELPFGPSPGS